MRIIKATILRSRRLSLRSIESVIWTPETDMQVILGTNGSGKSSLVELLTPLPAHSSDFNAGGSSTIEIEHNADIYTCVSDFTKGSRYSLLIHKDSQLVELNEGHTATAQRELCKQLFRITPEIHQLIIGRLKFTEMAPGARKEWIKAFSPTDLSFAFNLYNNIKTANRDTAGALKHLSNRISVETSKLLDMVGIDKLELLAKQLKDELNILMLNKEQGIRRNWDAETQLTALLRNVERCSQNIVDMPLKRPAFVKIPVPHGLNEIEQLISDNRQEVSLAESMLSVYTGEYMNLEGLLNTLQTTGAEGIDELSDRVNNLEVDETRLLGCISEFVITSNAEEIRNDTNMIFDTLVDIFTSMPDNSDRRYNQEAFATATRNADTLKYEIDRRLNRINQLEDRLAHLSHTDTTECPQCNHTFKPGVKPDEDVMLKSSIDQLQAEVVRFTAELTELKEYIAGADVYLAVIRRYITITNQYPRLSTLWSLFAIENMFSLRPKLCLAKLYVWQVDVNTSVVLESVIKERKSLAEALDHASRLSQSGSGHFTERGQHLSSMISDTTDRIQVMRKQRKELIDYREAFVSLAELKASIGRDLDSIDQLRLEILRVSRDDLIAGVIDQHQTTLALTQNTLNQKQTLDDIVADLKESAQSLALDKEAYQLLDDVLSPIDGFIAEQLHGTIHSIVMQLNAVIGAIWTYDLTVQPCGAEDGVLDYKFPLHIENEVRSDIYNGSEGQREIIDFAFRVLAYNHLNLVNFPLYLDETGRTMDEMHRTNIMTYIKENVVARQFSQAFLISHYAANHGSFLNAEVVVLDNANIATPDVYNTHFEIGYM